ncbi:amino acid adenylation domain-containing protein [Streptomyces albireticuli]|uniref:Amino acid adenylation protein n=2 Tax=Streptomyces albireticuli TaxID=1940 RepID=A0A2A2CXY4_9ACTN|nr:amino acid adenylation domain-containing protein [Streptomyces albireticuli]MCD9145057.1 amino acid adenylation domain-containing protein [Streptomyces albireticuli]MCD9164483.1 amino acid adenylation domain-containing protein [Streptomyces albireticuli]MCD9194194.1 amino acid adenylation domain-containing protein [Streptomyces albireticuli]PAU44131.1 amino acid adenylation protein [Streptomyces albireticuli]
MLLEQARIRPDATAVILDRGPGYGSAEGGDGRDVLTYRELAEAGTRLAGYLRHLGVKPDGCVGLFAEASLEAVTGLWGILFAGGAYLPLPPEYPAQRLRYMIDDARVKVVLTTESLRRQLSGLAPPGTRVVTLRDAAARAGSGADDGGVPRSSGGEAGSPRHLAYVIYTSGSTGKPKGVMIEHRSIAHQMRWLRSAHGLDGTRRVLHKTPLGFDAAQWEVLAPAVGGTVVLARPGSHRDPQALVEAVARHRVSTLQCVPTLLQALLDTGELRYCASLEQVFSGGEALSADLARAFLAELPGCELVNLYGPTECTINASSFTVPRAGYGDPAHGGGSRTVPIGTPVDGTRFHILTPGGSPAAVGEKGELYIRGVQLARGYLHRPDLTARKFLTTPQGDRLYRTGDLAFRNPDGTVQFAGRTDGQVKLRGFRVELDEIRLAVEGHTWVKSAAVLVKDDPRTGFQRLVSFVELNPKEAALMDQGNRGAHHRSKRSRLQVRAQLSNPGCRGEEELRGRPVTELPGREPTERQRRLVFARKTYRFFEGGPVGKADVLRLLDAATAGRPVPAPRRGPGPLSLPLGELGEILRYFGQFHSSDRLLPKYGYASPGSLYATQLYVETDGAAVAGLAPGRYYYHPVHHRLVLMSGPDRTTGPASGLRVHFIGKRRAIEPVYRDNIREVLEIETGHMVGLFDAVLPRFGLALRPAGEAPEVKGAVGAAEEDHYLGGFAIVPAGARAGGLPDGIEIYVQAHPGKMADLPGGQYRYHDGELERISDGLVEGRHVIAINQQVHRRASMGVTVVAGPGRGWLAYVDLGRALQHLQMNDVGLGFMSSGYSSATGHDLPAALRMADLLTAAGRPTGPSYFFVGGRVSEDQRRGEGMREDVVHMQGPAEMIKEDLGNALPRHMVPDSVTVLDRLPQTPNGKIDVRALAEEPAQEAGRPFTAPRTGTERRIAELWRKALKLREVSVHDDFFAVGGNSLIAVGLVRRLNQEFGGARLPLQILFGAPTVEELARHVDAAGRAGREDVPGAMGRGGSAGGDTGGVTRLVRLRAGGAGRPVFCWPGLGGYTMNLRLLATRTALGRPVYGVQAHGINEGEVPYGTVGEMAAADVEEITGLQPEGPYTLWGYSFGARVAFETAHLLEGAGQRVDHLFLIAPGSPRVRASHRAGERRTGTPWEDPAFVTVLYSVFAGRTTGPALAECLRATRDEETFTAFISQRFTDLDTETVRRVTSIARQTHSFRYTFDELTRRRISAPVTIFKADRDDYSFIENTTGYAARTPTVVNLRADHYGLLKNPGIDELVRAVRHRLDLTFPTGK